MSRENFFSSTTLCHFCNGAILLGIIATVSAQSRDSNCRNPVEPCDPRTNYFPESARVSFEFARTILNVSYTNTFADIVASGANRSHVLRYRIIQCGCPRPPDSENLIILFTNPSSLHVTESPSLALVEALDTSLETLTYVNFVSTIFSPQVRDKVLVSNEVQEVEGNLTTLQADSQLSASIIGSFDFSLFAGNTGDLPFLVVTDALELSPLGRAELVKIIGLFLGAEEEANAMFARIVENYQDASSRAREAARRPSVLLNRPFLKNSSSTTNLSEPVDDIYFWPLPHRDQYITNLLDDANADYVHEKQISSATLEFPVSRVIEDFRFARFHLFVGHFPANRTRDTLEDYMNDLIDLKAPDPRVQEAMATISAVRCNNVWGQEKRITSDGNSNDYLESAVIKPDEVLRDLVSILHPTVDFGDRELFYMNHFAAETDEFTQDCPYNDFEGPPPSSMIYVDNEFTVAGLNRFDVERAWEGEIQPALKALEFDAEYDILFEPENRADESSDEIQTRFMIRALTNPESEALLNETTEIREALTSSLGRGVGQLDAEGFVIPVDNGLSAAGIALIVIASIVVAVGGILCIFILLHRQRGKEFESQILQQGQGLGPPAVGIEKSADNLEAPVIA